MFKTLFFHDLISNLKNISQIINYWLFFIIFFITANLIQANNIVRIDNNIVFWIISLATIIASSNQYLKDDYKSGAIEQIILACYNFELYIFSKVIINWIILCLPLIIFYSFINNDINFIKTALIATFAINIISCFSGIFSLNNNSSSLIAIIALPLIIPILLIAQNYNLTYNILLPLTIFLFFVLSYSATKLLKIIIS